MDWAHDIEFRRWARVPIICLTHRNSLQVHFIVLHHNKNERISTFLFVIEEQLTCSLCWFSVNDTTLHYTKLNYPCLAIFSPSNHLAFNLPLLKEGAIDLDHALLTSLFPLLFVSFVIY